MSAKITHASIDENGKITGGKPGDQNGREVCTRSYYDKPWDYRIRLSNPCMRQRLVEAMLSAAKNECIGYNQNKRNTLINAARVNGYNPALVKVDVDCDCSSLVTCCLCFAGIPEKFLVHDGNCSTTRTLLKDIQKYAIAQTTRKIKENELISGDILLSVGHHVAVVTEGNTTAGEVCSVLYYPEVSEACRTLAKYVKKGSFGNGSARKEMLYKCVQYYVNGGDDV